MKEPCSGGNYCPWNLSLRSSAAILFTDRDGGNAINLSCVYER